MNAKQELLKILETVPMCKCAEIEHGESFFKTKAPLQFKLPLNYTNKQLEDFLTSLDFEYDSGYGGQELFGTVWLEDNTWLSRGEYDGSEWWEHNSLPEIPDYLL